MVSRVDVMILGLLKEEARHGYDLVREMEQRGLMRWAPASKVAVYKALPRLEERGFLTSWMEKDRSMPEKRVYALTVDGEEKLLDMLYALCSSQESLRLDLGVGLAFVAGMDGEEAVEALEKRRGYLREWERRLSSELDILKGITDDIYTSIIEHEISMYRKEAAWINDIIVTISGSEKKNGGG
ncbi:MAG: PadR family transcriptional regulator [Actinomycetota bacterium]|nr:PadR family transcriptional regulator [Actinomycetota bacterium]